MLAFYYTPLCCLQSSAITNPCLQLVFHTCMNAELNPADAKKCCINNASLQLHKEDYVGKLLDVR